MGPAFQSDKVMFEIYRDPSVARGYRVVYFTELDEHNKEKEIGDAMRGDHIFDGFLRNFSKEQGKLAVNKILERLNAGEMLGRADIESELKSFLA
jgi:hypothetical protein